MNIICALTIEDITTSTRGNHIEIRTKEGLVLNFSFAAAQEVVKDFKQHLKTITNES